MTEVFKGELGEYPEQRKIEYPLRISDMSKILLKYTDRIGLINIVLENNRFRTWTGSSHPQRHHYGDGGLQHHTFEVLKFAMENAEIAKSMGTEVDTEVLAIAALYHDFGKIWDYDMVDDKWVSTDHKHKIHHVHTSVIEFCKKVSYCGGLPENMEQDIVHCILSHHGRPEWGSAIQPQSVEAWILHLSDMLSARTADITH